ncbi:MAG: YibE/F family protein [Actinomycetota bacterium]
MSDAHDHGHGHGHSHGHGHGMEGGWDRWLAVPTLRVVLGVVGVALIATILGLLWLWPTGDGLDDAIENADDIGLVTERVGATVEAQTVGACSYSTLENPQECREITLILTDGPEEGALIILPEINTQFQSGIPELAPGDTVILGYEPTNNAYFYADLDRQAPLVWLAVLFAIVVVALGRTRGLMALVSMATTVVVLVAFIAPSVLDGNDPVAVAVVAAAVIAFVTLYLTHGFSPTTTVALAGTLGSLALTLVLSWVFFDLTRITGFGAEENLLLPFLAGDIDLAGLLLGGAVIGTLGALDDITVTQVAAVSEIHDRRPDLSVPELVASGVRVGREHIASTVNTLLLAYAGASLPILLLFSVSDQALANVANTEVVAVEIVRTLCGSIGLVAAVPLTTTMAALVVTGDTARAHEHAPEPPLPTEAPTSPPTAPPAAPEEPAPRWEDFAPEDPEL